MIRFAIFLMLSLSAASVRAQADVEAFLQRDVLKHVTISPTGEYLAMTVPRESDTGLVIMRRADLKVTAAVTLGKNVHVQDDFRWVSPTRIVFNMAEKFGSADTPMSTGELLAIDADGGKMQLLVGFRVDDGGSSTRIHSTKSEPVYAEMVDDLPNDDRFAIISVSPFSVAPQSRAEKMDVMTGHRTVVARVPVRRARFTTDHAGLVRFARGHGADNVSKLYYRANADAEWQLVNDEDTTNRVEVPLGFSRDDKIAYLEVENATGPDSIVAFDVASGQRSEVLRDATVDPWRIVPSFDGAGAPVGAVFMDGKPRTVFFDKAAPEARLQRLLEEAFPGRSVDVTSTTRDGSLALVYVTSADAPGAVYLFDTKKLGAALVFEQRKGLTSKALGTVRPVQLAARDGLPLHGYLTLPKGSSGKNLPLVLMPHGGPFGIFDPWAFDDDVQVLANAGYAVLQVNYRGSGNYGRAFNQAGAREWGGKMQDDLTDATRWAVTQGIADGKRICIVGASYGAYAAMMGLVREPALYRCAVGYVGVYDLAKVVDDLKGDSKSLGTYGREWIGEGDTLAARSPTSLAAQIKAPVLLVAGTEDKTAPIEHSKKMETALRKAGVSVQTLFVPGEGHGFFLDANRRLYYQTLLAFLGRNLAGPAAATAGTQ
jgi:dipeptidyl aminopeptidase/acylaminoacyl peptidase